jgi:hypothetical protein
MFSRISFLFVMILIVLCVSMAVADTGTTAAPTGPWWAALITALVPTLVIYLTSQIRSHLKDGTIKEIAMIAAQGKKYAPVAEEVLAAIEAKYPALKADVTKVETVIKSPAGQIAASAVKEVAAGLAAPVPPNPPAA